MSRGKKISIHRSMVVLTKQFLDDNNWDLSMYSDYNELLSDLHLYWIVHSAKKNYVWSQEYLEGTLSNEYALKMKHKLHLILGKMYECFHSAPTI